MSSPAWHVASLLDERIPQSIQHSRSKTPTFYSMPLTEVRPQNLEALKTDVKTAPKGQEDLLVRNIMGQVRDIYTLNADDHH
jgi:hypothetical protein